MITKLVQYLRNRHNSFYLRQSPNNMMWVTIRTTPTIRSWTAIEQIVKENKLKLLKEN